MPLTWRANRSTNGKGQRGTCDEHAWLPRDVSAALPDLACWVCERCGALHLDIPDPSTPGSDPPLPMGGVKPPPAGELGEVHASGERRNGRRRPRR